MIVDVLKKSRITLCRLLEAVLIVAVFVLVIDVLWGVFTRYALGEQAAWSEELARFLLIWISLLGGAVAFGEKAHLGVDYFVGLFDSSARKMMAVFAQFVVLFFAVSIFVIGGTRIVVENLQMGQTSPALGLQMGHVYLVLPIAGAFMIIFTVERLLEIVLSKQQGGMD
ncbi:MAG TPA: TRAP transporter small permease [Phycisphaerales bacterium]|nr:TRAP transporter small permease [Phycisphaerales bacterium]